MPAAARAGPISPANAMYLAGTLLGMALEAYAARVMDAAPEPPILCYVRGRPTERDAKGFLICGLMTLGMNNRDEAVNLFAVAAWAAPRNPLAHLGLGLTLVIKADADSLRKGHKAIDRALSLSGGDHLARVALGAALFTQALAADLRPGRRADLLEEARAALLAALRSHPGCGVSLYGLAVVALATGDGGQARRHLDALRAENPLLWDKAVGSLLRAAPSL